MAEKLLGRLYPNGNLEIINELVEIMPTYEGTESVDEDYSLDGEQTFDGEGEFLTFFNYLYGVDNDLSPVENFGFDEYGNLYSPTLIEDNSIAHPIQASKTSTKIKGILSEKVIL
ncbi:hypothetical protein [Aquibacillus saliphilus]|uniref:hypothetical protein n=1 Tax=Aquibacillus saliphilus TaxID=1909422 RepID=UPI001CF0509B|nr:hypothetical protein [Aquibacillus saliphilus]